MTKTRSTCEYTVQPEPDDSPRICGKTSIKRATGQKLDMVYCKKHFEVAKERLTNMGVKIEDV